MEKVAKVEGEDGGVLNACTKVRRPVAEKRGG